MHNPREEYVKMLRTQFPEGTRLKLEKELLDPYTRIPAGECCTVRYVDDIGTIHVTWDCGSSLGLLADVNSFCKVQTEADKKTGTANTLAAIRKQEEQTEKVVLELCEEFTQTIRTMPALEGVTAIRNSPACAQVSLSAIRKSPGANLCPEYWIQDAQANAVGKVLHGAKRATDVAKKLQQMSDTKRADCTMLNERTLGAIEAANEIG